MTMAFCAASAGAASLCVGAVPACLAGTPYPGTSAGLQSALDDSGTVAFPDADVIYLAAGLYESPAGFAAPASGQALTLQGSGVATTILRGSGSAVTTVNFPALAAAATFNDLAIEANSTASGSKGVVSPNDVQLVRAAVRCPASNCTAVEVSNGYVSTDESTLSAAASGSIGVSVTSPSNSYSVFEESAFSGFLTAISGTDASILIQSSMIDLGSATDAVAVDQSMVDSPSTRQTRLAGATIIGEGTDQTGVWLTNDSVHIMASTLGSSAIDLVGGGALPFFCDGSGGGAENVVAIDSGFDFDATSACDETVTGGIDILAQSPGYIDRASRNLRLRFDSPLRNTGEVYATRVLSYDDDDFFGSTRIRGTNFDIGAAEYQNKAPRTSGSIVYSRGGLNDNVLALSVVATDEDDEALSYAWSVEGVPIAGSGAAVSAVVDRVRFGSSASFKVVVTDPTGLSATETRSISVNRLPYLDLSVAPASPKKPVARIASKLRFVGAKPKGPRVLITSNLSAKARLVFTKKLPGRLSAKRKCSTSKKLKRGKRCVIRQVLSKPVLDATLAPGDNWISLGGRVAGKKLTPGEYEVAVNGDTGEDTDQVQFGFIVRK